MLMIRYITLLCKWIGWNQGNIATKYLCIINFILKNYRSKSEETILILSDIASKVLSEIIKNVEIKIREEDKTPLTLDDKILIREIALCKIKKIICLFF